MLLLPNQARVQLLALDAALGLNPALENLNSGPVTLESCSTTAGPSYPSEEYPTSDTLPQKHNSQAPNVMMLLHCTVHEHRKTALHP